MESRYKYKLEIDNVNGIIEGLQSAVKEQNITLERLDSTSKEHCVRLSAVNNIVEGLQSAVKEQSITLERLDSTSKEHCVRLSAVNNIIEGLQSAVKEQSITLERLDSASKERCVRLSAVELRDNPITVREAMRILETHICLDAAGSKGRFYKYVNIARISQSNESKAQKDLTRVLTALNLSEGHLNMLAYLKDNGDSNTHYRRPMLSKAEWISMLTVDDDAVDDDAYSKCAQDLMKALEHCIPCPPDGKPWKITYPMNKEKGLFAEE
jgi:hypothetical protein